MPPLLVALGAEFLKGAAYTAGCMIASAVLGSLLDDE